MEQSIEWKLQTVEQLIQAQPEIAGLQAYEHLRNNNAKQKIDFLSGGREDLELDYPALKETMIVGLEVPMRDALVKLMAGDQNLKTESLFRTIEYRYSELYMLSTAKQMQDESLPETNRLDAIARFKEASEALYGKPDPAIFSALYAKELGPLLEPSSQNVEIRTELTRLTGSSLAKPAKLFQPNQELIGSLRHLLIERFGSVIAHIDPEKTYTPSEMVGALQTILSGLGGDEAGWRAALVPDSSALAVSAHQKLVEVGENRKDILGDVLMGKGIHEVGVHALRSINAERAGYLAAAYGQDGYLDFEEALGTALEDILKGKATNNGIDYYLIAGLAYGQDGHEPRAFREVYEIIWRNKVLKVSKGLEVNHEQIAKAQSGAFTSCMRLFRGTDTKTPGLVYLKDLSYFRGQELAWAELDKVKTQADFNLFFAGKLDLTQSDHREVAKQILLTA